MSYRLCIDIGGTFTDLVVADAQGNVNIFKSPTTPGNYTDAFIETVKMAAGHYSLPLKEFMGQCSTIEGGYFGHGSTVSTNAIIEGKVAKTALLCTKGFRDILVAREAGKENPYDFQMEYPEPYIPRYLTFGISERINAEGGIEIALNEEDVRQAIRQLKEYKVRAIAVALLWSIANPVHELKIAEIIDKEWPGIPYSLSHLVNPCIREYRRFSSTAIDASLKPLVSNYVAQLEKRLTEIGYKGQLSLLTSSGGVVSAEELVKKPIFSVDCGPALAPSAGRLIAETDLSLNNIITTDMGGTSFDVACITGGEIAVSRDTEVGGFMLGINKVDSKSIGAGGGSIAWVDSGGLLHIGPQSAGAVPGPACYNKGGTEPTVTDANIVLGYLDPTYFLGGEMKLDKKLAVKAIQDKVAAPLNISVEEAAYAIWGAVNASMSNVIQDITVWRGIDPREYLVVSGGGAGGLHMVAIAEELGGRQVLIPSVAGALSAFGGAFADVTSDFSLSKFTESGSFDYEGIKAALTSLERQAEEFFEHMRVPKKQQKLQVYAEARYPFQVWELPVLLQGTGIANQKQLDRLVADFHKLHHKVFTVSAPDQPVEFVYWRVKAIGKLPKPDFPAAKAVPSKAASKATRKAYFKDLGGMVDTPIYKGVDLKPGNVITAPAIIEEPTTTILVMPDSKASITRYGNYLIEIGKTAGKSRVVKK
ncbi:MAG: hydantoinase/oxoprolinase family protein [Dehalococcoidia bacterium]|nr:hydantoinase/oxoprolinase family protein [Dehalococcoidia bacterium]MDD5493339.1 hydantoinase/oxoprolinase family protein [Dehalococcoidia bacterium]